MEIPGAKLLLAQALRRNDAQIGDLSSIREKARSYLTASGISVSVAGGLLSLTSDPGDWPLSLAAIALVLFVVVAVLTVVIDWATRLNITPNLEELKSIVAKHETDEDAIAYWTAREFIDRAIGPNDARLDNLALLANLQLIGFSAQVVLSVAALLVALS